MQRKMIIFCAVIVVLCSIGVYVSAGKQKLSRGADKWINESVNVLTATSAWIENEYELHALKKQKLKDIFIEKAEYAYQCDWWLGDSSLQSLERQEALPVELYWKDGTYYFAPTDECNTELSYTGRRARCNPLNREKYLFYGMKQYEGVERDRGWWLTGFYDSLDAEYVADMLYLGQVEIGTLTDSIPEMPKLTENGYIDAVLDIIRKNGNAGEMPVGNYKIYIGNYWYVGIDQVYIDGVILLDGTYKWFYGSAIRNSDGSYDAYVGSTNGNLQYFEYPIKDNTMNIVKAERMVIDLEITGIEEKAEVSEEKTDEPTLQQYVQNIEITAEEARNMIEKLYSYYQWFYVDVPYDIECLLEDGVSYDIFTDGKGNVFWKKKGATRSQKGEEQYAGIYRLKSQIGITMSLYNYMIGTSRQSNLMLIGDMVWHEPEVHKPELPLLEEDEYTRAVKEYVRNELLEKGEYEESWQIFFGRYEILSKDVRSISVAVTGKKDYYLQCRVTKYQDGTYECFPIGGSYAGEKSIGKERAERIIELARLQDAVFDEINVCRNIPFCDFSDIVKNHEILTYDICSFPKYDYENTPLAEYIEEQYVAYNEEMSEKIGMPLSLTIDYHQFDFNDDGLEDYLLCVNGSLFSGSAGNTVELYIQEEEGTVREVLDITLRLINPYSLTGHETLTVLDEKTDGYYAIVLPESNRILRYDKEKDWYKFHDGE